MTNSYSCAHNYYAADENREKNTRKALIVLWITTITMVLEIYFGYITGSMALLADGWHMATHAAAIGITYLTYRIAVSRDIVKRFNFGGGKIIALGGFASSVFLFCVVLIIGFESVERFFKPHDIQFDEALFVATAGLVVNVICAFILREGHGGAHAHEHRHENGSSPGHAPAHRPGHEQGLQHDHGHGHDHNIRGAYLHVLADTLTSIGAIVALFAGKHYGLYFLDPLIGLIATLVILKWAIGLIKATGWELLDGHALGVDFDLVRSRLETEKARILDLHIWKIAPNALACELILESPKPAGIEHYRKILHDDFHIKHSVIEERVLNGNHTTQQP